MLNEGGGDSFAPLIIFQLVKDLAIWPQVAQANSECLVIEFTASFKYKTLYGKL